MQLCCGRWYGKQNDTNNEAESQALVDLLAELEQGNWLADVTKVIVVGDSRLVLDFATRKARPGKASLFLKVRGVQDLVKRIRKRWGCRVQFRHVGRALNAMADWAGNVARELQADVDCTALCNGLSLWD
jgi:ribonuclease HI